RSGPIFFAGRAAAESATGPHGQFTDTNPLPDITIKRRHRAESNPEKCSVYFLKRLSKARRAESVVSPVPGLATGFTAALAGEVSFSISMRNAKNVHSFRASFRGMRSGIGSVHSNCAPVSKCRHCLQEWSSNWQREHW